jgi:hypothetical protein
MGETALAGQDSELDVASSWAVLSAGQPQGFAPRQAGWHRGGHPRDSGVAD